MAETRSRRKQEESQHESKDDETVNPIHNRIFIGGEDSQIPTQEEIEEATSNPSFNKIFDMILKLAQEGAKLPPYYDVSQVVETSD